MPYRWSRTRFLGTVETFADDFNRADGAGLGANWTKNSGGGTMSIVSNAPQSVTAASLYTCPSPGSPDHYAAFDYRKAGDRACCRVTNNVNYVAILYNLGSVIVQTSIAGVNTVFSFAMPLPVRMELRCIGLRAYAYADGAAIPALQAIDISTLPVTNACGINSSSPFGTGPILDNFSCGTVRG